jgi:hypothetical protein
VSVSTYSVPLSLAALPLAMLFRHVALQKICASRTVTALEADHPALHYKMWMSRRSIRA